MVDMDFNSPCKKLVPAGPGKVDLVSQANSPSLAYIDTNGLLTERIQVLDKQNPKRRELSKLVRKVVRRAPAAGEQERAKRERPTGRTGRTSRTQ